LDFVKELPTARFHKVHQVVMVLANDFNSLLIDF